MKSFNLEKVTLEELAGSIELGTFFSIARYGDGELYCLEGRQGENSQGCKYTEELRSDLIKTLEPKKGVIHMVSSTMLAEDKIAFEKYAELHDRKWLDTEIFPEGIKSGELKKFFDAIRKYPIVIISSEEKRKVPLPYVHFIQTPISNTHAEKERIKSEVLAYGKPAVYLFACGMAATVLAYELHDMIPYSWFLDIGHILDPFIGIKSRGYLEELTHEQIFKNL